MSYKKNEITNSLIDYALNLKYEDIPPAVIERTKQMFLDYLGVAYGGLVAAESSEPIIQGVLDLSRGSTGDCTVLGRSEKLPAQYASLLNATFAHSMDFDDTHRDAVIHIGTPLFSTLLALAHGTEISGRDFLTAAVVGYDVTGKIRKAHGGQVHARGFHPTATTGIFGCTAAGARLLGYTKEQTANALGLNISQASGSTQFLENGSWNKRFHTGWAAHNSIVSLIMARHDYLGSSSPLEGSQGYFELYANGSNEADRSLDKLGTDFEVMNTAVKPYPCCRYSHATIDAVTDMVVAENLATTDIKSIGITMGSTGYGLVGSPAEMKRKPTNVVEGQFSVYFAAAASARSAAYSWSDYEKMHDSEIQRLMEETTVNLEESWGAGMESDVESLLTDGRKLQRRVEYPKGEPENPMSWKEMTGKFSEWAGIALGLEKTDVIASQVTELESIVNMDDLISSLSK